MMNMQFALALLSVVALSTAAPQNFPSHFQVLQVSTTDPTPSTNTTIITTGATRTKGGATSATTGASHATNKGTEDPIHLTAHTDGFRELIESTTEVVSKTTTEEEDGESSTNASNRTGGGVRTTSRSAVREDRSEDQGNATKLESGDVKEPTLGFNFKLPSYFTAILQTIPTIGSAVSNTTGSEISPTVYDDDDKHALTDSQNVNGGLTIDSKPPLPTINRTTTASVTTTASPFVAVSPSSSRHNVLSTSDLNNQNSFNSSGSFDAPSSSWHNVLSTSDFNNKQTPFNPEHLTRVQKSLTESKLSRGLEYIAPPFTAVGEDNSKAYHNDYNLQSFKHERTPTMYEEPSLHNLNNGGYSGQFQYIIKASNLPGVLATFPASASSSAIHSSSPANYSSQGTSSTGSQSGVGHVSLASQPLSHVSLLPNFQSSSNINLGSNPRPSFGFAAHQQTKVDSASGTLLPKEPYYSTTTEGSLSSQGTNRIFSTRISDSSNNVTSSSNEPTEFPLFVSSEVTSTSTVGVEENTDQKVELGKPRKL